MSVLRRPTEAGGGTTFACSSTLNSPQKRAETKSPETQIKRPKLRRAALRADDGSQTMEWAAAAAGELQRT
eukprot:SAG31_NODE_797_length_12029_cov_13.875692_11_plen_71_part_00